METSKLYRGIEWTTNKDLSIKLGFSHGYVASYIRKGKTYEEIIDSILDISGSYRGISWSCVEDLAKKLNMDLQYILYLHNMMYSHKSYEEIIDRRLEEIRCNKLYEKIIDDHIYNGFNNPREYRGITWNTNEELSKKLGRYPNYVRWQHIRYYKSYREIIDQAINDGLGNPREYRGITWSTDYELSKKLGKNMDYLERHFRHKRSYEEIIDRALDAAESKKPKKYRGITWTTDADLSRKLGKSDTYVGYRIKMGKTYEEIIDHSIATSEYCGEYRGITWKTDEELSRKLNQTSRYVRNKREQYISYEQIIDEILNINNSYRGITWTTDIDLSRKLYKTDIYVRGKIREGYTYEEIIDLVYDGVLKEHEYHGVTWTYSLDLYNKLKEIYSSSNTKKSNKTFEQVLIDSILDSQN